ncbi:hypothetical protein EDB81DRAFT_908285 [Dactylonectria macrodidyma]|uniref:Extracellular membrane protein CFEM domain-containing protein n=1 Tax=Dactylonectria macrodidyma TaxID=307937 RepID=A0A9P9JG52_9HYPO|nr:hypothetical protein EDB81DRAFT_908285 [Dactylonectria macrodidyma]
MAPLNLKQLLLRLAGLCCITRASDTPQSITALPACSQQRQCATSCFFNESGDDLIGNGMECCEAYSDNNCQEPVDDAAVALYYGYCGAATVTESKSRTESESKPESEPTQVTTRTLVTEPTSAATRAVVAEPLTTTQPPGRTDISGGSGNTANVVSITTIIVAHSVESGARIRAQQASSLSLVAVAVLTIILQTAIAGSAS